MQIIFVFLISRAAGLFLHQKRNSYLSEVTFVLYNENNRNGTVIRSLKKDKQDLKFIENKPCVFVTHGWMRNIDTPSVQDIVQAYLQKKKVNIIAVDWRKLASVIYSSAAKFSVPKVGLAVGKFVVEVIDLKICPAKRNHLIGHSLGAHVVGIAGKVVQERRDMKVARITGLDPAGPMYEQGLIDQKSQLSKDDAECVDCTHTDRAFGHYRPLGQVDFYPNGGGPYQPGCPLLGSPFCSHMRAFKLYALSVLFKNLYLSKRCRSYNDYTEGTCDEKAPTKVMGYPTTCEYPGNYYLTTTGESPYTTVKEN